MTIEDLKEHFTRHLLRHDQGIHPDDLVRHVEQSVGPVEDTHRNLMHSWIASLHAAGHLNRADDWVNLSEDGRIVLLRSMERGDFNFLPF